MTFDALDQATARSAAPVGKQQQIAQQNAAGFGALDTAYQRTGGSPVWQTGGNTESTQNGWDTEFYNEMLRVQNDAADKGESTLDLYRRGDFTGVVAADLEGQQGGDVFKFGDVYEKGQRVGNILDGSAGLKREDGLQILGQLMPGISTDEYGKLFNGINDIGQLDKRIREEAKKYGQMAANAEAQQQFKADVDEQKDQWDDTAEGIAVFAAGAGGAAALASPALALPVAGEVIVGAAALIGGLGALANRDSLVDQAAQASIKVRQAEATGNGALWGGAVLESIGGLGTSAISPLQNWVQGGADFAITGEIGDGIGYYDLEDKGLWEQANMAALFGDSLLQFGSPLGRGAYLISMGATATGRATQFGADLASDDDNIGLWDVAQARFDGADDLGQVGAGAINVGIDFLQLGMGAFAGRIARQGLGPLAGALARKGEDAADTALGRLGARLANQETHTSFRFRVDPTTGQRKLIGISPTILVPSETINALNSVLKAQRSAGRLGTGSTVEGFQQRLFQSAVGYQSTAREMILVNGIAEGWEEGVQEVFENLSHGRDVDPMAVGRAAISGFLAGAGMGAGTAIGVRQTDVKELAKVNKILSDGARDAIKQAGGTDEQQEEAAQNARIDLKEYRAQKTKYAMSPQQSANIEAAAAAQAARSAQDAYDNEPMLHSLIMSDLLEIDKRNADVPGIGNVYRITGRLEGEVPTHHLLANATTVKKILMDKIVAAQKHLDELGPKASPELQAAVQTWTNFMQQLEPLFGQAANRAGDPGRADFAIREINKILRAAWLDRDAAGEFSDIAKLVSALISRNPKNSLGSYQMLLPQIGLELEQKGALDGFLSVSSIILQAQGADFDGDAELVEDGVDFVENPAQYLVHRRGAALTAGNGAKIRTSAAQVYIAEQFGIATLNGGADESIARQFAERMRIELKAPLPTLTGWSEVVDEFITRLLAGDSTAKAWLLDQVHTGVRASEIEAAALEQKAFFAWGGNVFHGIETTVNRNSEMFRRERAQRRTRERPSMGQNFASVKQSPDLVQQAALDAATMGLTLAQMLGSTDPFRMVQKLKYSGRRAPNQDLSELLELESEVVAEEQLEWVRLFTELESAEYRSALDATLGVNEVGRIAQQMLQHIYNTYTQQRGSRVQLQDIQSLSGMAMDRVIRTEDGSFKRIGEWTFGQFAVSRAADLVRHRASGVLDTDLNLAKKLDTLSNLNFGQAFRELFGPADNIALLGDAGFNFADAASFEQARVKLLNMDPVVRREQEAELKADWRYKASIRGAGYTLEDLRNKEVNTYRVYVDALLEETNTYLKITDPVKGTVGGSRHDADVSIITEQEEAMSAAYTTIRERARLLGLEHVETYDQVNAVLMADPDWTASLMAGLDPDVKYVDFGYDQNRRVRTPLWFRQLFLEKDHKYAAKTLWWQTVIAKMLAYQAGDVTKQSDDRLIRLFIKLGQENPDLQVNLFRRVEEARTIEDSMQIINQMIHFGGPQLAFYRDAAEFDISSWEGGWSRSLPGTNMREQLRKWFNATQRWSNQVLAEVQAFEADQRLGVQMAESAELQRLVGDMLEDTKSRVIGLTGGEMMKAALALIEGVSEGLTDKAADPVALMAFALNNARGLNPSSGEGLIQALDSRAAYSVEQIVNNPQILQQRAIVLETETGGTFVWNPLDKQQFIDLWNGGWVDPADHSKGYRNAATYRPMLKALVLQSGYQFEEGVGGSARLVQVALSSDLSLSSVLSRAMPDDAWRLDSFDSAMKFISIADAYGLADGGNYELFRQAVVLAHTWKATSRSVTVDTGKLLERAFVVVAKLNKYSVEHGSAFLTDRFTQILAGRESSIFTRDPLESEADLQMRKDLFRISLEDFDQQELSRLTESGDEDAIDQHEQRFDDLMSLLASDSSMFERQLLAFRKPTKENGDPFEFNDPINISWRLMVQNALQTNAPIVASMNVKEVQEFQIIEHVDQYGLRILGGTEQQQDVKWATLARAAAGSVIQNASTAIGTRLAAQSLPMSVSSIVFDSVSGEIDRATLGTARYFDPSFSFLVEPIIDSKSTGAASVRKLRSTTRFQKTMPTSTAQDIDNLLREIYDPARYEWTLHPELSAALVDSSFERLNSAGVSKAVTYAGSLFSTDGAVAKANERTFRDPAKAGIAPRDYVITSDVLTELMKDDSDIDLLDPELLQGAAGGESLAFLNGRFVTSVLVDYVDEQGQQQQAEIGPTGALSATYTFSGANSTAALAYEALTLETLKDTLRHLVKTGQALNVKVSLWHPDDKPATKDFAGNMFFEGLVFNGNLADVAFSLFAALDFMNDGRAANEEPFKAKKAGKKALRPPTLDVTTFDLGQDYTSLGTILREETNYLLSLDLGYGSLDYTLYNAIRKTLTLNRMVRAKDDAGGVIVYSVEEVLEAITKGRTLPGRDFQVLPRSQRGVRTLFGQELPYGATVPLSQAPGTGLDRGFRWTGKWTEEQLKLQPGITELDENGEYRAFTFADSKLLHGTSVRRGGAFTLYTQDDAAQVAEFHADWNLRIRQISDSRYGQGEEQYSSVKEAVSQFLARHADEVVSRIPQLAFSDINPRLVLPSEINPLSTEAFHNGFTELRRMMADVPGGVETAWVITDEYTRAIPDIPASALLHGIKSLDDASSTAHGAYARQIMPGDMAVLLISAETFPGSREERIDRLRAYTRKLATLGVRIAVISPDGDYDMVNEVGRMLDQQQYVPMRGARQFWMPRPRNAGQSVTSRARLSRETEVSIINRYHHSAMIVTQGVADEGTLLINPGDDLRGRYTQFVSEMLPLDGHAGYHLARSGQEKADVKAFLDQAVQNQTGEIDLLVELTKQADAELKEAIVRKSDDEIRAEVTAALQRAQANLRLVEGEAALPNIGTEFSTGDFMVFVSNAVPNQPREMILVRRGHAVPSVENIAAQQAAAAKAGIQPIAVYASAPRAGSTTRQSIKVTGYGPADGSMPVLEGLQRIQPEGMRAIVDPLGVKYTTMTMDGTYRLPAVDVLPGMPVSFVGAYEDRVSKDATWDVVRNYQKAIAFIGMDFTPYYAEALLGIGQEQWINADASERSAWQSQIHELLTAVRNAAGNEFDEAQVRLLRQAILSPNAMLRQALLGIPEISRLLPGLTETAGGEVLTTAQYVTIAAMIYLQYRRSDVSHVLVANGFGEMGDGDHTQSAYLPSLFTESFDQLTGTTEQFENPIHDDLMSAFRSRLGKGAGGSAYILNNNWSFVASNRAGEEQFDLPPGYLAFPRLNASSEHATGDASTNARRTTRDLSTASNRIAELALGLMPWGSRRASKRENEVVSRSQVPDRSNAGAVFNILNGPKVQVAVKPRGPRMLTGLARIALDAYSDAWLQFEQPLDRSELEDGAATVESMTKNILNLLNTSSVRFTETDVDTWVRMWTGAPKARGAEPGSPQEGRIGADWWITALKSIEDNLRKGLPPTFNSMMPVLSYRHARLFGQSIQEGRFKAISGPGGVELAKDNIQEVYLWAIGQANNSETLERAFLPAIDGAIHTYRAAETAISGVPLSVDTLKNLKMVDPANDVLLLNSDSALQIRLTDPRLATTAFELGDLRTILGGTWAADTGIFTGDYPPPGLQPRAKVGEWRAQHNLITAQQSRADLVTKGSQLLYSGTTTAPWVEGLLLWRYSLTLANPAIIGASIIDNSVRGANATLGQLITGEASGTIAAMIARARGDEKATLALAKDAAIVEGLSSDHARGFILKDLQRLPDRKFKGLLRPLSAMARAVSFAQDWSIGVRQSTLMRVYWDAVRAEIERAPELYPGVGSIDLLRAEMQTDPLTVYKKYETTLHLVGLNRLRGMRGLKLTSLGVAMNKVINKGTSSSSPTISNGTQLLFQMQYMFRNFLLGTGVEYAGARLPDALTAMLFQHLQNRRRIRKAERDGSTPNLEQTYLDEVLDSTNLASLMIRDGITHAQLLLGGMLLGGANLATGDDPEERRRRRAAAAAGLLMLNDPTQVVNDLRNADAIYFDQLPDWAFWWLKDATRTQSAETGEVHSMANLHWTLKQFISPALGIAEALETGDIRHIGWGFEDAFMSMPLSQATNFTDAAEVAQLLQNRAEAYAETGDPRFLPETTNLLMDAVWNYERMLLESSFVNQVYQSLDAYDRNPYRLIDVDADNNLQRDDLSQPMESDALNTFVNQDTGLTESGYAQLDPTQLAIRGRAESRFTVALLGSLINGLGGQPSMLRTNMAIQQERIDRGELTAAEAEAIILVQANDAGIEELTVDGAEAIINGLRMQTVKPGDPGLENIYISYEQRVALAEQIKAKIYAQSSGLGLSQEEADQRWETIWYGPDWNPYVTPLYDVVFSQGDFQDAIPYNPSVTYNQLNTTFIQNPVTGDWLATGLGRNGLENFFGLAPLNSYNAGAGRGLTIDSLLNTTDQQAGLNTGMRALERTDENDNPTDEDLLAAIEKIGGTQKGYSPNRYPGYGGGGSSYSYRVNSPVRNDPTNGRNVPYVNADNPIIRRSSIRRERISSDRGRLKQWQ